MPYTDGKGRICTKGSSAHAIDRLQSSQPEVPTSRDRGLTVATQQIWVKSTHYEKEI